MPQVGVGQEPKAGGEVRIRFGEAHERRTHIGDEAGERADADAALDGFREPEHRVDLVDDAFRNDPVAHEAGRLQRAEIVAERDPGPVIESCEIDGLRARKIGPLPINRPGDRCHAPADEGFGRIVGRPDRDVGVALGEVQRLIGEHHVEAHVGAGRDEARKDRRQQVDEERVVGRDPQLPSRRDRLSRELAREPRDVFLHSLRERRHLLARGGERIAGAVPFEELHSQAFLDLAEAPENGRVIDAEVLRRAREPPRLRDRSHELEIIPQDGLRHCHPFALVQI